MKSWFSHLGTKILLVILVFSLAEIALLLRQVQSLENALTDKNLAFSQSQKPLPKLEIGETIPELEVINLDNIMRKLDWSDDKILFVYSVNCPFCTKNFENWKVIEQEVGSSKVMYLSTDDIELAKDHALSNNIAKLVYCFSDGEERRKLKIAGVPQTIYIANGKVKAIQAGVLKSEQIEIFKSIRKETKS
jgi:hypothetical protein